jgi:hypothetical protein
MTMIATAFWDVMPYCLVDWYLSDKLDGDISQEESNYFYSGLFFIYSRSFLLLRDVNTSAIKDIIIMHFENLVLGIITLSKTYKILFIPVKYFTA